ncbi:MAG: hypothetical protein Q4B09_08005 [Lachnospiraceae bacterium]|nr:hypothetical protein [Lachnospiraceae bacterium]
MNWSERWSYFRTYYLWKSLLLCFALLSALWIAADIRSSSREPAVQGLMLNVNMNTAGFSVFTDDYCDYLGLRKKDNPAQLSIDNRLHFLDEQEMDNATYEMVLIAQVAVGDYDYLVLDGPAYRYFVKNDIYADLDRLLPESLRSPIANRLVKTKNPESGEEMTTGISLKGTALDETCDFSTEEVYLVAVNVNEDNGRAKHFIDYLTQDVK